MYRHARIYCSLLCVIITLNCFCSNIFMQEMLYLRMHCFQVVIIVFSFLSDNAITSFGSSNIFGCCIRHPELECLDLSCVFPFLSIDIVPSCVFVCIVRLIICIFVYLFFASFFFLRDLGFSLSFFFAFFTFQSILSVITD